MFEYVKWCNSLEEDALDNCFNILFDTFKYSINTLSKRFDFFGVKSTIFNTIHFLTNSPILLYILRFKKAMLNYNSSNQLIGWFPCGGNI